jgi:hypothetical protein
LLTIDLIPVVAPSHPLAAYDGLIETQALQRHVQLVLTDRSAMTAGRDYGVLSSQTWRLQARSHSRPSFLPQPPPNSVYVPVVQVGIVGMVVSQRLMTMPMSVRFGRRSIVVVLVVGVVHVPMLVLDCLVRVCVVVALG